MIETKIEDFAVQLRLYNNQLKERRHALGMTQATIAKAMGVPLGIYSAYENFGYTRPKSNMSPPWNPLSETWTPTALKIANFHCVKPEELFSLGILSVYQNLAEKKLNGYAAKALVSTAQTQGAESPEVLMSFKQRKANLKDDLPIVLKSLTPREHRILHMRFYESKTLEEVGKIFNVNRERARQIEAKALRKLRHSSRSSVIAAYRSESSIVDDGEDNTVEKIRALLYRFKHDGDTTRFIQEVVDLKIHPENHAMLINSILLSMTRSSALDLYTEIASSVSHTLCSMHNALCGAYNYKEVCAHMEIPYEEEDIQ